MQITVFRGTKEIGGTCIEVTTQNTRVIMDTGIPLVNPDRSSFDARSLRGKSPEQLAAERVLPAVPGLFRDDGPLPDAILLSHAHIDHSGLLPYTRPEIPIYATSGTSKMMLAGAVFSRQSSLDRERHRTVSEGQSFTIGDLVITPLAVDHSTFGSVAFLLEGDGATVLYSGDLRTHGRKPGMLAGLLKTVARRPVDVLLVDGTHLGADRERGPSEQDVEELVVKITSAAPGLVLACFSPVDLDRVVTVYRSAVRTKRTFVADAYTAFVLHLVASRVRVPRPTRASGIRVFFPQAFTRRNNHKLNDLFAAEQIELAEVLAEPNRFLMVSRPSMIADDFGGEVPARCRVIYSYWEGYLTNPDWVNLHARVLTADGEFVRAHATGHIYPADLKTFVTAVNPQRVVPIHTFEPQRMRELFPRVFLPVEGEAFNARS